MLRVAVSFFNLKKMTKNLLSKLNLVQAQCSFHFEDVQSAQARFTHSKLNTTLQ